MKNKKSCSLCAKLTNMLNINYVEKCKFLILIPVIIIAMAIAMTSLFGVNYTEDLRNSYQFTVNFGVEIQDDTREDYIEKINEALEENDLTATKYLEKGEVVYTSFVVSIDSSVSDLTEEEITNIQESLEKSLQESINSTVEVSEMSYVVSEPTNYILITLLAFLIAIVCIFVYTWIRHNIVTATSMSLGVVMSAGLMFVFYGLFRLPFNYVSLALILVASIVTLLVSMNIFDEIKNTTMEEKSYTNNEYVAKANNSLVNKFFAPVSWLLIFAIIVGLIMFIFNLNLALALIGLVFAIIVACYSSLYITTSLWAVIYNKAKDQKLRNRIERQKTAEEKKAKKSETKVEEDKIVV